MCVCEMVNPSISTPPRNPTRAEQRSARARTNTERLLSSLNEVRAVLQAIATDTAATRAPRLPQRELVLPLQRAIHRAVLRRPFAAASHCLHERLGALVHRRGRDHELTYVGCALAGLRMRRPVRRCGRDPSLRRLLRRNRRRECRCGRIRCKQRHASASSVIFCAKFTMKN